MRLNICKNQLSFIYMYIYIQNLIYTEENHILGKFQAPELLTIIDDAGHHQYYHLYS